MQNKNFVGRAHTFSEICLCFNINIKIFSPYIQLIVKNSSKQFTNSTEQSNALIIFNDFDVPLFENRNNKTLAPNAWVGPSRNNDIKQFM